MKGKAVQAIVLMLLATSMTSMTVNPRTVDAEEKIYILSDGSIEPPTASITGVGNVYTFTANISRPIVIQKDSIVVDGNGYWLRGQGEDYGFSLNKRNNVTIRRTRITGYRYAIHINVSTSNEITESLLENNTVCAIWLEFSTATDITNNNITSNYCAILLTWSGSNNITNNTAENNSFGIWIIDATGNIVRNNTLRENDMCGIWLDGSSAIIYSNNFMNNTVQAVTSNSMNIWDNSYPAGGNYWSNCAGVDMKKGPGQDQPGSDGIIDVPYKIDANSTDRYPLKIPINHASGPDLNSDGIVNIIDITIVAKAFGSHSGTTTWNPNADLDNNGLVNILDITLVAKSFGKKT